MENIFKKAANDNEAPATVLDARAHHENVSALQKKYADEMEAQEVATTYEQTRKLFLRESPQNLFDKASAAIEELLEARRRQAEGGHAA